MYLGDANVPHLLITGPSLGALQESPLIRNFPSQTDISGLGIMQILRKQADISGAWLATEQEMTRIDLNRESNPNHTLRVWVKSKGEDQEMLLETHSLVIAMGSKGRRHEARNIEHMWGYGVYPCAICDGTKYRDLPVAVIGGGDAAVGMAIYLSNLASLVYILLRGDTWRTKDQKAREKVLALKNVRVLTHTTLEEVVPRNPSDVKQGIDHIIVMTDSKRRTIPVEAVFLAIGADPLTEAFRGHLKLDRDGYIVTNARQETSVPGVFAAGEICTVSKPYKQAITAASDGCKASFGVRDLLSEFSPEFLEEETQLEVPFFALPPQSQQELKVVPARDGHRSRWMPWTQGQRLENLPRPSILLMHQPGCMACEKMLSLLPSIAQDFPEVKLWEFSIDNRFEEADDLLREITGDPQERVRMVPIMFVLGKLGQPVQKMQGLKTPEEIRQVLSRV